MAQHVCPAIQVRSLAQKTLTVFTAAVMDLTGNRRMATTALPVCGHMLCVARAVAGAPDIGCPLEWAPAWASGDYRVDGNPLRTYTHSECYARAGGAPRAVANTHWRIRVYARGGVILRLEDHCTPSLIDMPPEWLLPWTHAALLANLHVADARVTHFFDGVIAGREDCVQRTRLAFGLLDDVWATVGADCDADTRDAPWAATLREGGVRWRSFTYTLRDLRAEPYVFVRVAPVPPGVVTSSPRDAATK